MTAPDTLELTLDDWFRRRLSDDRDLTPEELESLGADLVAREDLWRPLVRHDAAVRLYVPLRRDHHVEVWLICWMPGQDVGLHDHDVSVGAVHVVDGEVVEERLEFGRGELWRRVLAGGESFRFDSSRIHNVAHAGDGPATTIHLYSPPLWRMGFYEVADDGLVRRRAATYVEELHAS
ncbi:MAG TPA: cysteine dioxygenase family protein [Gaiellales bacterium]|nr:cysteine dioxygenase family protein [Gaiellales bacterium]